VTEGPGAAEEEAAVRAGEAAGLGTVLAVWAHPDDETYLAGGLMASVAAAGGRVVCVSATAGERGTDDPATWPPDRLGRVRRWEAAAAMAVLGVSEHRILGYGDGSLDRVDAQEGVSCVRRLLDEVRPDTVLTFGPDGITFHPDHVAVSAWVTGAWRAAGRVGRLLHAALSDEHLGRFGDLYEVWGMYMGSQRPYPVPEHELAVRLRLSGELLDRKLAALGAMRTQTAGAIDALGPALFAATNADEMFVEVLD
jgi:LmbE family N-acetylglucosaminyl deacetylase